MIYINAAEFKTSFDFDAVGISRVSHSQIVLHLYHKGQPFWSSGPQTLPSEYEYLIFQPLHGSIEATVDGI